MAELVIINDYHHRLSIPNSELDLMRNALKPLVDDLNSKDYANKMREAGKSDTLIRYNALWWIPCHFYRNWALRLYKDYSVNDDHIDSALKYVIGIKE